MAEFLQAGGDTLNTDHVVRVSDNALSVVVHLIDGSRLVFRGPEAEAFRRSRDRLLELMEEKHGADDGTRGSGRSGLRAA